MQKFFKDVEFLYPKEIDAEGLVLRSSLEPFSDEVIDYLNALSKELNKDPRTRLYPDVATFGFFCRRANILFLKKRYDSEDNLRVGRGIVFHIAPSNVPVNFAYSLISGMLAGNLNIVRVPSKKFEQVNIIVDAIKHLGSEAKHHKITSRIILVSYNRQSIATQYFSSICDVRVIWGGDETIAKIRKNAIPPKSFDVTFADRYSLCVINADEYIKESSPEKIAQAFYNDTYLFDQNACTAPHLVIWLGSDENVDLAKRIFWDNLSELVKSKYKVQPVIAIDKLTTFYNQATQMDQIRKTAMPDNLIWRIELKNLETNIHEYRCTSGYFSEFHANSLSEISKIIDRRYQTLSYYGIAKKELKKFILQERPVGIDRIVQVGRTSDFSLTWDGFNLINTLTRIVDI